MCVCVCVLLIIDELSIVRVLECIVRALVTPLIFLILLYIPFATLSVVHNNIYNDRRSFRNVMYKTLD